MAEIRKSLGICPQHNVLFEKLSVLEHLDFFATLKGMSLTAKSSKEFDTEVRAKIHEVGLDSRTHFFASALSGGMQRKLSVAMALIGGSKVVFLDEPTSGMDPYSRRATWELLRKSKAGRTIILTTHFMDEADLLGDRIAIMAGGDLKCCGSSLFLKTRSGIGYTLTIVKGNGHGGAEHNSTKSAQAQRVTSMIQSFVPDGVPLSAAGGELRYRLPLSSVSRFPELFACLETRGRSECGIGAFGVAMTTLEEVFTRLSHIELKPTDDDKQLTGTGKTSVASVHPTPAAGGDEKSNGGGNNTLALPAWAANSPNAAGDGVTSEHSHVSAGELKVELVNMKPGGGGDASTAGNKNGAGQVVVAGRTHTAERRDAPFNVQLLELLRKRAICATRDLSGRFFEVILPIVVVALVLLILMLNINPAGPEISLNADLYRFGFETTETTPTTKATIQAESPDVFYSSASFEASEWYSLEVLQNRLPLNMIPTDNATSLAMSINPLLAQVNSHAHDRYAAYVLGDQIDVPLSFNTL